MKIQSHHVALPSPRYDTIRCQQRTVLDPIDGMHSTAFSFRGTIRLDSMFPSNKNA